MIAIAKSMVVTTIIIAEKKLMVMSAFREIVVFRMAEMVLNLA